MIHSIMAFTDGRIYVENETAKTIYLSNGKHFNSHRWHQARTIVNQFLQYQTSTDEDYVQMSQYLEERRRIAMDIMTEKAMRFDKLIEKRSCMADVITKCQSRMPFGKYRNRYVREIYQEDERYFWWFFENTVAKLDDIFERPDKELKPLALSAEVKQAIIDLIPTRNDHPLDEPTTKDNLSF